MKDQEVLRDLSKKQSRWSDGHEGPKGSERSKEQNKNEGPGGSE